MSKLVLFAHVVFLGGIAAAVLAFAYADPLFFGLIVGMVVFCLCGAIVISHHVDMP